MSDSSTTSTSTTTTATTTPTSTSPHGTSTIAVAPTHAVAVDVLSPAFVTKSGVDDKALTEQLVAQLGLAVDASDVALWRIDDRNVACEVLSSDFSLEYVETLLFENAKLRVAIDELSLEVGQLARHVVAARSLDERRRNLREFEAANPDKSKSLRSLIDETVAECESLEEAVKEARRRAVEKRRKADRGKQKASSK